MLPAKDALARLRDGNRRFVSNVRAVAALSSHDRRAELTSGQEPFAIVLGCSDSRVPAEIVFDQGLGDLFVIRVAGNIVAPSQVGSVEFAADRFGTRLAERPFALARSGSEFQQSEDQHRHERRDDCRQAEQRVGVGVHRGLQRREEPEIPGDEAIADEHGDERADREKRSKRQRIAKRAALCRHQTDADRGASKG